MKYQNRLPSALVFFFLGSILFMVGCDGGDDGPEPPAVDVSGTWNVSLSNLDPANVTIAQNGNSIQGTTNQGDQVSGSIEGNDIAVTVILPTPGDSLQLNGTASATTMSGTYSGTVNGLDVNGTWSGLKI